MNYSKKISREAVAKRVLMLLVVVGVIMCMIGVLLGYALKTHITAKSGTKTETQTSEQVTEENRIYGAYDDRVFTEEISLDWETNLEVTYIDCDLPEDQQEFLFYLCNGYNLDFTFVMALIQAESSYDPDAISATDDWGLMQINSMNHEWITETIGVTDFLDPYENMRAGCYILRKLFERYTETDMVLMAYHMGESGASRLWKHGIYNTRYTDSVLAIQKKIMEVR